MLYIVLLLVLAALGLLITALTTANTLWAWVSVVLSVAAAGVLVADWLSHRRAARSGSSLDPPTDVDESDEDEFDEDDSSAIEDHPAPDSFVDSASQRKSRPTPPTCWWSPVCRSRSGWSMNARATTCRRAPGWADGRRFRSRSPRPVSWASPRAVVAHLTRCSPPGTGRAEGLANPSPDGRHHPDRTVLPRRSSRDPPFVWDGPIA